jgi:hypothetical protein
MANRSTGRKLRLITLSLGTWAWVVSTLVVLVLLLWLAAGAQLFG